MWTGYIWLCVITSFGWFLVRQINCTYLVIKPAWCNIFLIRFISFLYIFRTTVCPSSGELVLSIYDNGHIVALNMYRKEINSTRKIMHQVGFIYKIIRRCTVNKTLEKKTFFSLS